MGTTDPEAQRLLDSLTAKEQTEIERLISVDCDKNLAAELGRAEAGSGALPDDLVRVGQRVWREKRPQVVAALCENEFLKRYVGDPETADRVTVAALLSAHLKFTMVDGVNYILLGCIAARVGLRNLCKEH